MATHGGSYMPQSDLSQTGQGDIAQVVQVVAHATQDDKGSHRPIEEDDQTPGHVACEVAKDQTNEPGIFTLGWQ